MVFPRIAPARGIELHGHQMRRHFHDMHLRAVGHEALGGLESEQATANDDRNLAGLGPLGDGGAVFQRAKNEHAVAVGAGDGGDEGARAGGDDQFVVGDLAGVKEHDGAFFAVDADGRHAGEQLDSIFFVPRQRVEGDFFFGLRAVKNVGKEDAVVVAVGFAADDGDLEALRRPGRV